MHETSLVQALFRQVETLAAAHPGRRVTAVRVHVGPLSGVEPLLLNEAYDRLAPHTVAADAQLLLELVPMTAMCNDCRREFTTDEPKFVCPHCGGRDVRVLAGDAVVLESISLEAIEPACFQQSHE